MKLIIDIDKELKSAVYNCGLFLNPSEKVSLIDAINNGTPLTPDVLADMLMEERIRGELKQDISYSKDVIDDVRCRLTVDIIDHNIIAEQEPKTGHWIRWYERKENDWCIEYIPHCKCSECGTEYDPHSSLFVKYCNECGVKMQESESEEK